MLLEPHILLHKDVPKCSNGAWHRVNDIFKYAEANVQNSGFSYLWIIPSNHSLLPGAALKEHLPSPSLGKQRLWPP